MSGTSRPYRGPLAVLSHDEAQALLPLLKDYPRGSIERRIFRKAEVAANSDPRFRKPTT